MHKMTAKHTLLLVAGFSVSLCGVSLPGVSKAQDLPATMPQPQSPQGSVAPPSVSVQVTQAPAPLGAEVYQGAVADPTVAADAQAQAATDQQAPARPQLAQQVAAQASQPPAPAPIVRDTRPPPLPSTSSIVRDFKNEHFSVTPEQIISIYREMEERKRAAAVPIAAPRSVSGTINVSMAPGAVPPVVRGAMGYSTILVITDLSGAEWPVENFVIGNKNIAQLTRLDSGQGSTFSLDMVAPYGSTNIAMKLAGVPAPIVIDVVGGQKEVDVRLDVRVVGRGPNATTNTMARLPRGVETSLLPVLSNIAPDGARALAVNGLDGISAWLLLDGSMVVRTPYKIVSPAIPSFISSADGTYVYKSPPVSQLLARVDGQNIPVSIAGY